MTIKLHSSLIPHDQHKVHITQHKHPDTHVALAMECKIVSGTAQCTVMADEGENPVVIVVSIINR